MTETSPKIISVGSGAARLATAGLSRVAALNAERHPAGLGCDD